MSNALLINTSHVKQYILRRAPEIRPGWEFRRVSRAALADIDTRLRLMIDRSLERHPSIGCTFKEIQ